MRRIVAVGLGIGAALVVAAPAAPARQGLGAAVVAAMNDVRADAGVTAVRCSPSLRAAAAAHTAEMVRLGYFGHTSPVGGLLQRMPRPYRQVGEILFEGTGAVSAGSVVEAWLESPEHRRILLGSPWRDVGVWTETVVTSAGPEVLVTVDFGSLT